MGESKGKLDEEPGRKADMGNWRRWAKDMTGRGMAIHGYSRMWGSCNDYDQGTWKLLSLPQGFSQLQ